MVREFQLDDPSTVKDAPPNHKSMKQRRRRRSKNKKAVVGKETVAAVTTENHSVEAAAGRPSFIGEDLLDWSDHEDSNVKTISTGIETEEKEPAGLSCGLLSNRRALAFDTRIMSDEKSSHTIGTVINHQKDFLMTLIRRGTIPEIACCTVPNRGQQQKGAKDKIDIHSLSAEQISSLSDEQPPNNLFATTPFDPSGTGPNGESNIPKALAAKWSWKVLSAIVQTIVSDAKSEKGPPIEVSILTSDASFFADVDEHAHEKAVNVFWDSVQKLFASAQVSIIHIIVAQTNSLEMGCGENDEESNDNMMTGGTEQSYKETLARCIHRIRSCLATRWSQQDQHLLKTTEGLVNIELSIMDNNSISYQALAQQWARQSVGPLLVNRNRLQLDLPETTDGTQCSLSLSMNYQVLPCPVNHPQCESLLEDLAILASSEIEIVQSVPLQAVDVSLLYGVPIVVRAGLEENFEKFQTLELLAESLFSLLQERDIGLLLCASPSDKKNKDGCFASPLKQNLLLMPREYPKSIGKIPHSGLLFRYATAEMFLMNMEASSGPDTKSVARTQLADYVDGALDCLKCNAINPLVSEVDPSRKSKEQAVDDQP